MLDEFSLRGADVKARDNDLRERLRRLSQTDRVLYYDRYETLIRDPDTYATLAYFMTIGLHHFYLGHIARGLFDLGVTLIGLGMLITGPVLLGLMLLLIIGLLELPALFRSQIIVENHNIKIGEHVLKTLHQRQ